MTDVEFHSLASVAEFANLFLWHNRFNVASTRLEDKLRRQFLDFLSVVPSVLNLFTRHETVDSWQSRQI